MEHVTYTRNPYPLPLISEEGIWTQGPVLGAKVSPEDKNWGSTLKAHERLFAHHTLNSIRKDHRLIRSKTPIDSLDLALTAVYTHSKDTLVPKKYVIMQPESLGRKTWRVLKNEIDIQTLQAQRPSEIDNLKDLSALTGEKAECYRGPMVQRRLYPSTVKLNIDGPHSVQSNPGYSRKIDGTFYSV